MVSIVICSITPAKFDAVRKNLSALLGDEPHEVVRIHDARSMAEGCNRGIRQSKGERIILCHDDIEVLAPDFRQIIQKRLETYDLIGIAGSTRLKGPAWVNAGPPHIFGQIANWVASEQLYDVRIWSTPAAVIPGVCVMDGVFLAGKREVFEKVPLDEQTFQHFHLYDIDFTYRAFQAGFKLAVCNELALIHASTGNWDERWTENAKRFTAKHQQSFHPEPSMSWAVMRVKVPSKQQLLPVMRSPHWKDANPTG